VDRNVRLIGFASGIRASGASMVSPFITIYLNKVLGIPYAEIGFLFLLVGVAPLLLAPGAGLITDRVGRRRIIILGLATESASVFMIGYSMFISWLPGIAIFATLSGVAGSLAGPAVSAYVADMAEGAARSLGYTWLRIGFNVGFTVGVGAGGFLIDYIGYPQVGFLAGGILAVGVLVLFALLAPSTYDNRLQGGLQKQAEHQAGAERPGSVRDSLAILAKDRRFLIFCFASMVSALVYGQWSTTFPLFIRTVEGVPTWLVGLALATNGAIVIFGQTATTKAMIGKKHTTAAALGLVLFALAFVALGAFSLLGFGVLLAAFSFVVLLTIGENLGAIPMMTLPSNLAPSTERGSYNGAFNTLSGIGGVFAPLAGGLALSATSNPLLVWGALAMPVVPAVAIFLWLGRKIPAAANTV
jgi:MFS family permease